MDLSISLKIISIGLSGTSGGTSQPGGGGGLCDPDVVTFVIGITPLSITIDIIEVTQDELDGV